MTDIFRVLKELEGTYTGDGINHEGQKFTGEFSLAPGAQGATLKFSATGANGEKYHVEESQLGLDGQGQPCLFVNSNNHPQTTPHVLTKFEDTPRNTKRLVFAFGDMGAKDTFREEIVLEVYPDKKIDYRYSWGLPQGDFAERSGALMAPANSAEASSHQIHI